MSARDDARSLEEARTRLDGIRRSLERQDSVLLAAHAQLDAGRLVAVPAALREQFEALCAVPARRGAATTHDVTDLNAIRC